MIHKIVVLSSGWSELAARSHHSWREGFSSPTELVQVAAALGMPALGLCDRNSVEGATELAEAATTAGIHPVIGVELDLAGDDRLRLLAADASAYRRLAQAIDAAPRAVGHQTRPRFDIFGDVDNPDPNLQLAHRRNKIVAPRQETDRTPTRVDPHQLRGCIVLAGARGSAITGAVMAGESRVARRHLDRLGDAFGRDNIGLLLTHHRRPADPWLVAETAALAARCRVDLVASNLPVHATDGNSPKRLKSEAELRALLGGYPQAFHNAAAIAARCDFR